MCEISKFYGKIREIEAMYGVFNDIASILVWVLLARTMHGELADSLSPTESGTGIGRDL